MAALIRHLSKLAYSLKTDPEPCVLEPGEVPSMTECFRVRTLTCCVALALGGVYPSISSADSGLVADTVLGNALNPGKLTSVPARDPDGLDAVPYQRSPTGFLYGWPKMPPEKRKTESGWELAGWVELGLIDASGDESNGWFRKYKDVGQSTGAYLNNFYFKAGKEAYFFEGYGGGFGYDDQFLGLKGGRYNDWKINFFYNETPHVFTSNYYSLWSNIGAADLKLIDGLTPGGSRVGGVPNQNQTLADVGNAVNNMDPTELSLVRKKGGVDIDKYITNEWRAFARYSLENREGARPFGSVWGGGGGNASVEIPESIDYDTHEIIGGLRFDDGRNNLNLQMQASLFRNNISTLRWENPLVVAAANGITSAQFTTGEFDLYPDNDYYNLLGEYARSFNDPYRTRVTAVASVSRFRQNDELLPQSMYPTGVVGGVAGGLWDNPASLSKQKADAKIDSQLYSLGVVTNPTDKLAVQAKIRYYDTDNKTDYFACNPLTGQIGRVINNGSGASLAPNAYNAGRCDLEAIRALGVPATGAGGVKIRNTPYEYERINYTFSGDYRLGRATTLNLGFEREEYDRKYRERDETNENKFSLGYTNRGFDFGSLRLAAEYAERRGSAYNVEANPEGKSMSLGPDPTSGNANTWAYAPAGHRKYDLADRDRLKLSGRFNLIAVEALDIGLTGEYVQDEYPNSQFGRTDTHDLNSVGLDVSYQPSAKLGLSAFYNYQDGKLSQTGNWNAGNCTIGVTPGVTADNFREACQAVTATGVPFRTERTWEVEHSDQFHMFGLGGRYDFGFARAELDYTYVTGTTEIDYQFNATALGITNPDQLGLIGTSLPDLKTTQRFIDLNLIVPVNKSVAVRGLYRYEKGTIDDWHYSGTAAVNPGPTAQNRAHLDGGPENYESHIVGLFLQVSF